ERRSDAVRAGATSRTVSPAPRSLAAERQAESSRSFDGDDPLRTQGFDPPRQSAELQRVRPTVTSARTLPWSSSAAAQWVLECGSIPIVITLTSFYSLLPGREATADIPAVEFRTLLSSHGSPQGPRGLA